MTPAQSAKEATRMLKDSKAFSTFSVDDVPRAKQFYGETLGLDVSDEMETSSRYACCRGRPS